MWIELVHANTMANDFFFFFQWDMALGVACQFQMIGIQGIFEFIFI